MRKDRWDGKYIKPKDSVHAIVPYLFERRHESEVYINQDLDFTKLKKWVDEKNKSLDYKMTYFHAMAAVVSKTVYSRPLLNRFVQGHRIYERKYFSISFVAKDKLKVFVAYTKDKEAGLSLKDQVEQELGVAVEYVDALSLSVACHIGPGALAVACSVEY